MKLALSAYLHGAGGAERQIILLANEMVVRCHEVHLIVLCENNTHYHIDERVIVHDLSEAKSSACIKQYARFAAFKRELSFIKPDITINYNIQSAFFSLLSGRNICGKIVYSERGDPYDKEYNGVSGKIRNYTVNHVDGVVFQTEGARDFFSSRVQNKSIIIHNSVVVPQNKYLITDKRDNRIVTVGRLHPQKNPHLLIDAFAMIANSYPNMVLDMYGDGILHDEIQNKIIDLGLTERIHLNPSRKDIFDCICSARLFVLASDYEGMPNALMEAMALGLPCIATDCRPGGARTLIEDGRNGLLSPVKDVNALAEKMSYMLNNPKEAERMAIEARLLGESHTNKVIFDKWDKYIASI